MQSWIVWVGGHKIWLNYEYTTANHNYNEALSIYSRIHETIEQEIFRKEGCNIYRNCQNGSTALFWGAAAAEYKNLDLGHICGQNIRSISDLETR